MASFLQIEEYAERHSRALSDSHARLWKETHEKTDHPGGKFQDRCRIDCSIEIL
jgi:hypothetical protein